jgi:hypothetical protein
MNLNNRPDLIQGLIESSDLTKQERKELNRRIEVFEPDLWRKCYPKTYKDYRSNEYVSPKTPALQMVACAKKMELGPPGQSELIEIQWASNLTRLKVPTYWVRPDLAKAIQKTKPPLKLDWYNMKLPVDAAVFMLPRGLMTHSKEGNINFISYSVNRKDFDVPTLMPMPWLPKTWVSENGGMTLFAQSERSLTHWNIPLDKFPILDLQALDEVVEKYEHHEHASSWQGWGGPLGMDAEDTKIGSQVAHLIFGLLVFMLRKPEMVTVGERLKRLPAKKNDLPKEIWSPTVIGENYKIRKVLATDEPRSSLGGTHASPRVHWVTGYWREQPYGPKNSLSKDLWIEPYVRGVEEVA